MRAIRDHALRKPARLTAGVPSHGNDTRPVAARKFNASAAAFGSSARIRRLGVQIACRAR